MSTTVIDHLMLLVSKTNSAQLMPKYEAVFATIGINPTYRRGEAATGDFVVGFGGLIWVKEQEEKIWPGVHVAFKVKTRSEVDNFFAVAMQQGFKNNGEPGGRPRFGEAYYGAYVIDDAGNNLEIVCREAPST